MLPPPRAMVPVRCCRFCGCTPEDYHKMPDGDHCMYPTPKADRCSHPGCLAAFEAERRRLIEEDRRYRALVRDLRLKSNKRKKQSKQRRAA